MYTLARVAVAVLGTAALWLLYATGARLFGRAVGLLAAAIEAVAFLPVFYAHLALNDAPTLAPATLSLLGSAGVLRKGRARDHLLAGVGLGLACATKYTAGIVIVPLAAAIAARFLDDGVEGAAKAGRRALGGILLAGRLGARCVPDRQSVRAAGLPAASTPNSSHQSTLSAESQGKLGAPKEGGLAYYLWSFTWGLGWAPALAALGGALDGLARASARSAGCWSPPRCCSSRSWALQGRYFGRWLMPIFPIACLLAAFFVVASSLALGGASAAPRPRAAQGALAALLVAALLVQGLVYSVHAASCSRARTRAT